MAQETKYQENVREESYVRGMYKKGVLALTLSLAGLVALVSGCASQPVERERGINPSQSNSQFIEEKPNIPIEGYVEGKFRGKPAVFGYGYYRYGEYGDGVMILYDSEGNAYNYKGYKIKKWVRDSEPITENEKIIDIKLTTSLGASF